eukprot:1962209-Pleurochrysis_carterae.AAC.3
MPVIGFQSLFEKVWRSHTEIRQLGAKKHAKCDTCGTLEVEMVSVRKKNTPHAQNCETTSIDARRIIGGSIAASGITQGA